jgi:transposase
VAWAASRKKRSHFRALFTRITARRGPRKAIVAVAAILTTVYWLLRRGVLYADLGADHFERIERTRLTARLTRKLAELGFQVTLADRPAA